ETQSALKPILFFSTKPCGLGAALSGKSGRNSRILPVPPLCEVEATSGRIAVALWTAELTIKPPGSGAGRGNRNCFFTRFVVKRHAYGAKRISAFCGHPRKLERVGRDFARSRSVFRSAERPQSESASRGRHDAARDNACES